jgi:hypothetical protein
MDQTVRFNWFHNKIKQVLALKYAEKFERNIKMKKDTSWKVKIYDFNETLTCWN